MIAVLTGGSHSERKVSLFSAKTITDSLARLGLPFAQIDVADTNWLEQTKELKPEVCVIAIHGTYGEDGQLQGVLEESNLRFTGSSSSVSQLAFDKRVAKEAVREFGITTPREYTPADVDLPVIVKPAREGSSIGITLVDETSKLTEAINLAKKYDPEVIIEEYISGKELSCAVTDIFGRTQAWPIIEIRPKSNFFDYDSKYTVGRAEELCPAPINETLAKIIHQQSKEIFTKLGIGQYCRIDWMLKDDVPYFIEINTIPGMTSTSLINKEIAARGGKFDNFIQRLVETAR